MVAVAPAYANAESKLASYLRVAVFTLLLAPLSVPLGEDEVSANYSFALLLLLAPLGYKRDRVAFVYVFFCVLSWIVGALVFSQGDGSFLFRQSVSAGLWLAGAMLLFVRMPFTLREIGTAAVIASVAYSVFVFVQVVQHGTTLADVYAVKASLRAYVSDWPQRYVVVLMFAFFVAFEASRNGRFWAPCAFVILACIFITFTRAAWLSVAAGFVAYGFGMWWSSATGRRATVVRPPVRRGARLFAVLLIAAGVFYAGNSPTLARAFVTLYDNMSLVTNLFLTGGQLEAGGSEEIRLTIWLQILDLMRDSPLTGTGFAGPGLLIDGTGAAHSQYFDVLLRTGIIGLAFYLFFWSKALAFYAKQHPGIFAGLVAIGTFGLLHETTKLSYGALLFFVLLNKASELRAVRNPRGSLPSTIKHRMPTGY